jgi:hypothetical protein
MNVYVRISNGPHADPDPVTLKWRDRLIWDSHADKDYTIEFTGDSPFESGKKTFVVKSHESCDPGAIKKHAEKKHYYHDLNETVAKKTGEAPAADPEIIVTP